MQASDEALHPWRRCILLLETTSRCRGALREGLVSAFSQSLIGVLPAIVEGDGLPVSVHASGCVIGRLGGATGRCVLSNARRE